MKDYEPNPAHMAAIESVSPSVHKIFEGRMDTLLPSSSGRSIH